MVKIIFIALFVVSTTLFGQTVDSTALYLPVKKSTFSLDYEVILSLELNFKHSLGKKSYIGIGAGLGSASLIYNISEFAKAKVYFGHYINPKTHVYTGFKRALLYKPNNDKYVFLLGLEGGIVHRIQKIELGAKLTLGYDEKYLFDSNLISTTNILFIRIPLSKI